MTKGVAIAVVGAGLMGARYARALSGMPGVRLAGVVDIDRAARSRLGAAYGVSTSATVADLDAHPVGVVVALPDNAHREVTIDALDRDLAVLVEKPLATSTADAEAILAAGRQRLLMVGHLLRFDPRYVLARRRVQDGELGDLLQVYARRNSAAGSALRYGSTTRLPFHVSVHDLDLLRWVTGREVSSIRAHGVARALAEHGHLDSLQALLRLSDGSSAVIESCWMLPKHLGSAIDSRMEVTGTRGMLEVSGFQQGLTVATETALSYPDTTRYAEYDDGSAGGLLAAEVAHFASCIERQAPPAIAPEEGLAAVRLAAALEQALRTNTEITLTDGMFDEDPGSKGA